MVDITETSNTNLEELTQVLEDMDNLDMDLLNNSFKKAQSATNIFKDSNVQLDGDLKKKVIFKEKKNFLTSGSKTSLMEDLFKIKTPVTSATNTKINNESERKLNFDHGDINELFLQKSDSRTAKSNSILLQSELCTEKYEQKPQSAFKNDEDTLMNLHDSSKLDVIGDKSKRSSLIESLFESKSHSSSIKNAKLENFTHSAEHKIIAQKQTPQLVDQSSKLIARESRRGRRNAKVVNDPLGLLSTELLSEQNIELVTDKNVPAKSSIAQKSKLEENLPEWLGGTKKLEDKSRDEIKEQVALKDKLPNNDERIPTTKEIIEYPDIETDFKVVNENKLVLEDLSLLSGAQFNQQAAIITMQQQEHELRTASIISQQNEQLGKVSEAQHSILHNQEKQFNLLLKLQFEKQHLLEKQIRTQQERINQYLQTLMAQPTPISSTTSVYTSCKSDESEKIKNVSNEPEELENTIKTLQTEKSKLESVLSTINERHNNEVTCQVQFYERQISFLKEGMLKFEERIRQETEVLETNYIAKLEKLRNEKIQMENLHKEEIYNIKNEHAQRVQELNELHSQNIKLLQKEYSNTIESICRAKQTEDQVIETITTRKVDMEDMLQKANFIIENIKQNKEKTELKDTELMDRHENYLKIYEDDIKAQKIDLKNQSDILREDHNKFIGTIEIFRTQFTQLIEELQKVTVHNNQTQETLENKTASLLKERELFEEKAKWERDYLQALKESWVKEHDRQLKLIVQEREEVAAEKAQLQIMNRLKINSDDVTKIELEAAIQTAQEAAACADRTKLKWQEKINELNVHKQILQDKENLLVSRAKELEKLTQSALRKKEEGMKALKDAKHLENQYKETLGLLQIQFKALMEKEKRIVSEQYNVSKGQMISVSCETEKPERDINVSRNVYNKILPLSVMHSSSQVTSELMKIVDPNLLMLKLNLNDHYNSIT
ncbi:fas-binding factor 1 twitchy isoform X2 [Nomia melanderi]|uniref:fas-binding factor 1 twitchy isoform X2 n=1 Tax=Nomia melanderi TaxID=2448451 RepID=UPI003FCEAF9D